MVQKDKCGCHMRHGGHEMQEYNANRMQIDANVHEFVHSEFGSCKEALQVMRIHNECFFRLRPK